MKTEDRLLQTKDVADWLGVDPTTVLRWSREGKLPRVVLSSRAIRFRREDVEKLIEGGA